MVWAGMVVVAAVPAAIPAALTAHLEAVPMPAQVKELPQENSELRLLRYMQAAAVEVLPL